MSSRELDRLELLQRVSGKLITQAQASSMLGISVRQMRRLVRAHEADGPAGLVSKRRGQPSNNRITAEKRAKVLELVKMRYADFGPTFANEKLLEEVRPSVAESPRLHQPQRTSRSRGCSRLAPAAQPIPTSRCESGRLEPSRREQDGPC